MARLIIMVDGSFSGPNLTTDPRLNAGSLVLVEPGHPVTRWDGGLTMPNLAASQAATVLGSATGTSVLTVSDTMSASTGTTERTGKGALHLIAKRSGSLGSEMWLASLSTELQTYITANATHSYFASLWGRITRATGAGYSGYALSGILSTTAGTARLGFYQVGSSGAITTSPASGVLGRTTAGLTSGLGAFRVDLADDAVTTPISTRFAEGGNISATVDNAPSWIWYATYLEDLTVSGRTYAEASAADQEAYAVVFGAGGRYEGDTWTDPATIP